MCCQVEQTTLTSEGQDRGPATRTGTFGRGDYPKRKCERCGRKVAFHWWLARHRDGQCTA
jgi:hypothetical protein